MNKRQKEVQQAFLDDEKAVLKKLEENYVGALAEINSKIELLMARQDADMSHVIYQVEYQRALKTQVQSILETLQTNEFETVSEYLANAYHSGFIGTMYDIQGQGIPLIFPIDQEAVVAAVQADTKLSAPLYTAMGKDITELKKKITGEISRGLSSGQMYGEISRNIASWAKIPKNNAMRIARTEAHRIQIKATADAQHRAKEKGADIVKQWDATLDKRTRESHRKVDGEIRELDEKFSNGLMYPGDPNGPAGEVINCRCALLQRARWNLGSSYTKWSEDAPIVHSDDGTTQFAIIEAKNYKEFQKKYKQASERVRSSTQKMKSQETIEKTGKIVHNIVDGNDVVGVWQRRAEEFANEIDDIVDFQRFNGKPQVMDAEDFADAVKKSGFYAERTYSAKTQELLEEYRNELYGNRGKAWYVDCGTGGADHGQGMYTAATYDIGNKTALQGIAEEMKHYREQNVSLRHWSYYYTEGITLDASAKIIKKNDVFKEYLKNHQEHFGFADSDISLMNAYLDKVVDMNKVKNQAMHLQLQNWRVKDASVTKQIQELMAEASKKEVVVKQLKKAFPEGLYDRYSELNAKDRGIMAAEMGYDAINAEGHGQSGSYTVILNRTKVIFKKGGVNYDE